MDQNDKQVMKELRPPPDHIMMCAIRHRMIVNNLSQVYLGKNFMLIIYKMQTFGVGKN